MYLAGYVFFILLRFKPLYDDFVIYLFCIDVSENNDTGAITSSEAKFYNIKELDIKTLSSLYVLNVINY